MQLNLKRNLLIELEIISNGMNGEGIARFNGKVVFVVGAVEGDVIKAEIVKDNKNFITAKMVEVVKPSKSRAVPICEYFETCGGCDMQHICYNKTLDIKTQNVQGLFNKKKLNFKVECCQPSPNQYAYRNKLTFAITNNSSLGFYIKNSKNLLDINSCKLVDESFNNLINKLNIFLKNNKQFSPLILKGVAIRQINNLFIINLHLIKKINLIVLENYLKLNKINYSLYYSLVSKLNGYLPKESTFVGGVQNVMAIESEVKYPVYPLSFMQVNSSVKQQIYNQILSFITQGLNVLDAYSGAGLLSAYLAKKSKMVFAVEVEKSASLACEKLCKINNIKNLKPICGLCEDVIPALVKQNKIDVAILDPARKGADEKTLNALAESDIDKIIYLSCNPATLARDLEILINKNYKISFAKCYDMFPQTANVETLVVLQKAK